MPTPDEPRKPRHPKRRPRPTALTRLSVWFPSDEMDALHALAAKTQRSEQSLVREAVTRFLRRDGQSGHTRRSIQEVIGDR